MPEHLRALVVVLFLSIAVFVLAKQPVVASGGMKAEDFVRRRNLWFLLTLSAFLAHSIWIFMAVSVAIVLVAGRREPNPTALYLLVLMAVPSFAATVGGAGLINQLLSLNYPRLLALALLLPAAAVLCVRKGSPGGLVRAIDLFVLGFIVVQLGLRWQFDSTTNTLRYGVYALLDVGLPYYVASRGLRSMAAFRETALCFVIASIVLAPIAIFEFLRHWLLYGALDNVLGAQWGLGNYLNRSDFLRAQGTTGHPIALGYVMAIALMLHLYLRSFLEPKAMWWLGFAVLVGGLVASLSRGPWVGAVVGLVVFAMSSRRALTSVAQYTLLAALAAALVLVSPWGDTVIDHLPFIGTVEESNISYRQRLIEVAIDVVGYSPWFGISNYMQLAEVQDQLVIGGMVDIVNSYVGVVLSTGLVGLTCFVMPFVLVLFGVWRVTRQRSDDGERAMGQALLAVIVTIMVTIFTTSSITIIPVVYWAFVGVAASYVAWGLGATAVTAEAAPKAEEVMPAHAVRGASAWARAHARPPASARWP